MDNVRSAPLPRSLRSRYRVEQQQPRRAAAKLLSNIAANIAKLPESLHKPPK